MVSKKRFDLYEESSKQNQSRMVTIFGQQVYTESLKEIRNCLNPLLKDRESVGVFCSQDTIDPSFPLRIKASDTYWFGQRSENVIISGGSGLIDLNKTPVNEPVSSQHQQCFFQDLNCPYIEVTEMSCVKSIHEKDGVASLASCCTAENDSRNEEDSSNAIQMAAECLVYISLDQSKDFPFKLGSRSNSSSQDQDFLNKPEMAIEEPCCSCDSFELHTLGIRETTPEDVCCVSSKAIVEFDLKNKEELGVKVRRGRRRMKNFQKEILPGLASLSRHEIHEDLNILEAVSRSREYKKMQGKSTRGEKCRPNSSNNNPVQRYVGRRRRRVG